MCHNFFILLPGPLPAPRSHVINTPASYPFGYQGIIMPVVIVKMRKGWSLEQKRTIVKEITGTLVRTLNIEPELVTILIDELELENIGKAGKLRSDTR
jgi:4-oxalocrotonate tautomerase